MAKKNDMLVMEGGGKLSGSVKIGGAKNAALSIFAASILSDEKTIIKNVPMISDVSVQKEILRQIGTKVSMYSEHEVHVANTNDIDWTLPNGLVKELRGSILFMGPLLVRKNRFKMSVPGGDAIGDRPIDFHLKAFQAMGAKIVREKDCIEMVAKKLKGAHIFLDRPSTTATENIMIAASLAKGITVIVNAERTPEILDLAKFLKSMGAKIKGEGSSVVKIEGVERLTGTIHTIIPDPFEAGTYMVASAITKGDITIENAFPSHLLPTISKLREAGVDILKNAEGIRVVANANIKATDVCASAPYPAFQSDMQPIFAALMSVADGRSVIKDSVFEKRFGYVSELRKLGAKITVRANSAVIKGVRELRGTTVTALDIRGGAALALAGVVAKGKTIIEGAHHIDRGYERLEEKLGNLGAKICRIGEE